MATDHGLQAFFAQGGIGADGPGGVDKFRSAPEAVVECYRSVAVDEFVEQMLPLGADPGADQIGKQIMQLIGIADIGFGLDADLIDGR